MLSLSGLMLNGGLLPGAPMARAAAAPQTPNHFDPASRTASTKVAAPKVNTSDHAPVARPLEVLRPPVPMQPVEVPLRPAGAQVVGSDGAFEVDVPAGAVTASDLAAAGGAMSLLVRQVLPSSGSSAGGSGHYTFGTYLVQVLDARRQLWNHPLHAALDTQLHATARTGAIGLARTTVSLNQSLPSWFDATPPAAAPASGVRVQTPAPSRAQPRLGTRSSLRPTVNAAGTSMSAPVAMSGSTTTVTWESTVPVATFGKPDPFEPGLASGSLTAQYPLDVPAGPGGLTPPLTLGYSSALVNDQHSAQGAAPWVGEGWSLTMGAISWAEHNVPAPASCNPSQTTCPAWNDTWQLADPYGTAVELIPPDQQTSTYNDDTGYPQTASPITWHTASESRARVVSFTSPSPPSGMSPAPPCFRVWLTNGLMEEFGCTPDSLQFYPQQSGSNRGKDYIANWLLDLITDPRGNQVHVTYQQDVAISIGTNVAYPRDVQMAAAEWDSPGCHDPQNACAGASWQPLMRVSFAASHDIAHVAGGSCPSVTGQRCDNPADLEASGNLTAPLVQSTFLLNDALVQVRSAGSGSWSTLRDYRFAYDQSANSTITDPFSGLQESVAGKLDLMSLTTTGTDGSTALPPSNFTYVSQTPATMQFYEDNSAHPTPSTNCGPSWNTGTGSGCVLWSQSYSGNGAYLSSVSNGLGLAQTFTWQNARDNVSMAWQQDPFFCDDPNNQSTSACVSPDDGEWSRVVLTSKTNSVVRLSQQGQGGQQSSNPVTGTTTYAYQLGLWADCAGCTGNYWRSSLDFDQADFYNDKYTGFARTIVTNPDGSSEVHKFLTTEGHGVYDNSQVPCSSFNAPVGGHCGSVPFWDLPNVAHMHEYQLDRLDGAGALLQRTVTKWQAVCPPTGVSGSPARPGYGTQGGMLVSELDQGTNPVVVCDVQKARSDQYTYDGLSSGTVPDLATTYAYDDHGREISRSTASTYSVADSTGNHDQAAAMGGISFRAAGLVSQNNDRAMSFDGTGEVDTGYQQPWVSSYSVEAWIKTTDGGSSRAVVQDRGGQPGAGAGESLTLGLDFGTTNTPGAPFFIVDSNGVAIGVWSSHPVNDGLSHHLVGTWSGTAGAAVAASQFTLYVDGAAVPTSQIQIGTTSAPVGGQGGFKIGRHDAWNTNLAGTVAQVAAYTTALPAARVQAHFAAGPNYQAVVALDSPAAYYRLNDPGPAQTIVDRTQYVWNDSIAPSATGASGTYIINRPALTDTEDVAGNRSRCTYTTYDSYAANGFATGQTANLVRGNVTFSKPYTDCGSAANGFAPSGPLSSSYAYDAWGNVAATDSPDANAGVSGHAGCSAIGTGPFTTCTGYAGPFQAQPAAVTNALNQPVGTGYGTVTDSSGMGHHGVTVGTMVTGVPGLVSGDADTAMAFDGVNGYVEVPYSLGTNPNTFSAEAWASVSGGAGTWRAVAASRDGRSPSPLSGWVIYAGADDHWWLYLGSGAPGAGWSMVQGPAVTLNQPTHLVGTWANGVMSFYVNGVLAGTASTAFLANARQPLRIGAGDTEATPFNYFPGTIGNVAIYPSLLQASQVQAHFSAGANYQTTVLNDHPSAFYRLNDAPGAGSGFGLWPVAKTDVAGQLTRTTYDALGRETGAFLPGERAIVADSSGHGNQGEAIGSVGFGAAGLVNGDSDTAMSFASGSRAAVALNLNGVDTAAGHQVTVELWMKWSGSANGMPFGFDGYDLYLLPGTGFGFNTANGDILGVGMSAIPQNTPLHVVAVFTNGTETGNQLYINGVQQTLTQLTGTPQIQSVTSAATISGWPRSGAYTLNGSVGEVAVYNGVLPSSRVQAHFNAGAGYRSAVLSDSPLAYYRLDETGTLATTSTAYTVWCSGAAAQAPCVEVDRTRRLNGTTAVTSRAFYDGLGHLVETRSPAPGGQDVVRYSFYDASQRLAFLSVPYFVGAYTGVPGAAAYSLPDATQVGTTYVYDGLGRTRSVTDALSHTTGTLYGVVCGPPGTNDTACYEQTLTTDANGHRSGLLVDALGRKTYEQRYQGSGPSTYSVYASAKYAYDLVGNLKSILHPDGVTTTTFAYDMAGRLTGMTDPDRGSETYVSDQDGNRVQSVDARGGPGTVFTGYDGLDRPVWRNTSNTASGAYQTFTYDAAFDGAGYPVVGSGRLTGETFTNGTLSGGRTYTYDGRGEQTAAALTVGSASYALTATFDDAGNVLSQTYPTSETVTNAYTSTGWLSGVSRTLGSASTSLASNIAYAGVGGAFGEMTAANLSGTTYRYSATYDLLDRATDTNVKRTSDSGVIFDQARTFDAVGNVSTASTTLPSGTDNQAFCYDELDRLTWAGATGTPPCTGTAITSGTLSAAQYTQSFTYDAMGRLTSGPVGTYTYGDPAHVHGATSAGVTYTASYDAAGDMTCRALTTASTCIGSSRTGASLSYNAEGQLAAWQNAPASPTTTAGFLYDGEGQRVAQQVTQGGATTTTVYVGGVEEVASSGGTPSTTTYYTANGKRIALAVNGAVSYLASDALGSATVAFGSNGTASVLYAPYGSARYSAGTMPTSYGFAGQRGDAVSGLDYYGARYYDPVAGQFASADTLFTGGILGLSRYAYVQGNPIGRTDPSGHMENVTDGGASDPPPTSDDDPCGGLCDPASPPADPCANGGCRPGPPADRCGGCDPTTGLGGLDSNGGPPVQPGSTNWTPPLPCPGGICPNPDAVKREKAARQQSSDMAMSANAISSATAVVALVCGISIVGDAGCAESAGTVSIGAGLVGATIDLTLLATASSEAERTDALGNVILDAIGIVTPLVGRGFLGLAGKGARPSDVKFIGQGKWLYDAHGLAPTVVPTVKGWWQWGHDHGIW